MVTEPWHDPLHCARYALQICSHKLQSTFVLQFLLLNTKYVVSLLGLAGETTTTVRSCCNIGDLRGWWRFMSMQVVKNSHPIILGPRIPRSTSKLYVFFIFIKTVSNFWWTKKSNFFNNLKALLYLAGKYLAVVVQKSFPILSIHWDAKLKWVWFFIWQAMANDIPSCIHSSVSKHHYHSFRFFLWNKLKCMRYPYPFYSVVIIVEMFHHFSDKWHWNCSISDIRITGLFFFLVSIQSYTLLKLVMSLKDTANGLSHSGENGSSLDIELNAQSATFLGVCNLIV